VFFSTPDSVSVHQAVSDTLGAAVSHGGNTEPGANLFTELLNHVFDSHELEIPFIGHIELPRYSSFSVAGIEIDLSITKHVAFLWFTAFLLLIIAITAARRNSSQKVPKGIGNLVEMVVLFIRDEVALPNMGPGGLKYMPYLLTTFFFILIMNLAGLVPYGSTATSNVSVTGGLALIAFIMIQFSAIRAQGFVQYLKHLTGGVHWALWPVMVPIEILGLFTKPFALMIRLFANMVGGHIVIVSLFGLIFIFRSYLIAPVPILFALGINMLELFVAFLQAYIFTLLTSLFMGFGIQAAHGEGEGQEH